MFLSQNSYSCFSLFFLNVDLEFPLASLLRTKNGYKIEKFHPEFQTTNVPNALHNPPKSVRGLAYEIPLF
jgi:hypothetical protein